MKRLLAIAGLIAGLIVAPALPAHADTTVTPSFTQADWVNASCADPTGHADVPTWDSGVIYSLDGIAPAVGAYDIGQGDHEVQAAPAAGYVFPAGTQTVWDFTVSDVGPCTAPPPSADSTTACVSHPGCDSGWYSIRCTWHYLGYDVLADANVRSIWYAGSNTREVDYSGSAWRSDLPGAKTGADEVRVWSMAQGGTWALKYDDATPPPYGYYSWVQFNVADPTHWHYLQARDNFGSDRWCFSHVMHN